MKYIRAFYRFLFFILFTVLLISSILWSTFLFGRDLPRFLRIRQRWTRKYLLPALGVRLRVAGHPPDFPCILMGNHRSYLDPVLLCRDVLGFPVSKAEVENWPIVGLGVKLSGVLFLKRENIASRKETLEAITQKVKEGFPVILFPEGTTHAQPHTLPLKKGAFQLAALNGLTVVPVALEYRNKADYWIGSDSFVPHFFRRFGEKHMEVSVRYGKPLKNPDANELIRQTQHWLDGQLRGMQAEFL